MSKKLDHALYITFIKWMENSPEYVNLRFQFGDKLFMRENGVFVIQVTRVAFEAFKNGIHHDGNRG